jgi:hypothetical protein
MEAPGRFPQVFQNVDEVDHDRNVGDAAGLCFGVGAVDLVFDAVDEHDPAALVCGVAAFGLVEDGRDDGGGVVGDAGGQPFVRGDRWPRLGVAGIVAAGEDIGGWAGRRRGVVDGADGGEVFAGGFSPLDSRVFSFVVADSAAFAVAGRSASRRITTPLPS